MRKIIACILILCIIANQLFAAETLEGLTYEQERIYLQNHLSVQTSQHTDVSGVGYMNDWGLYTSFSEGDTTTEWTPYVGAREISKEAFYEKKKAESAPCGGKMAFETLNRSFIACI